MIKDYYQLTTKLIHDYIGSTHESTITEDFKSNEITNQYFIYQDDNKNNLLMVINITSISDNTQLINLINKITNKLDSILINWEEFKFKVEFPINELNVSHELIEEFNSKVKNHEREENLKKLFKLQIKSPKIESKGNEADINIDSDLNSGKPDLKLFDPANSSLTKILDKPDFEDEYEIKGKLGHQSQQLPLMGSNSGSGMSIGDDDLYPGGVKNLIDPTDPLRIGGRGNGNGMSPSFDHPLFRGPGGPGGSGGVGGGPGGLRGGPGNRGDHQPFGARYDDPMGPGSDDMINDGLPGYRQNSMGFNNNPFGGPSF